MNVTLHRAKDIKGLIQACAEYPGTSPWIMLRPEDEPVYHDLTGAYQVDPLSAGQLGKIPFPGSGLTCGVESSWINRLLDLLVYQFPDVRQTKATMMVWGQYELVAIVGVGSTYYTVSMARGLANDLADALKQIHETDVLRQELAAYRHITAHWGEPILVVRSNGNIQLGTEAGWDALHAALRRRPTKKNPVSHLPPAMTAALGKPGKTNIGKIAMTVGLLPSDEETVSPLHTVLLMPNSEIAALNMEQKIQTLTPTQKAVYRSMLAGRRNKEIAAELGIAYNTVIKHASAVLAKMGFMDRLQLLTLAAQSGSRESLKAPLLPDAPVMPDLEVRKKSEING